MEQRSLVSFNQETAEVTLDLKVLDEEKDLVPCFDCLVILNNYFPEWMLRMFICKAKVVIASDGGANLLYNSPYRDTTKLYCIVGDLDSLSPQVEKYYEGRKVSIKKVAVQDTNDFQKAILLAQSQGFKSLVCLGALGGRMDQQLCNLSAIEKFSRQTDLRFIALGPSSLMFIIRGGETASILAGWHCEREKSGIFCFGRSQVTTTGFEWNLCGKGAGLQWGKFVSSSNRIQSCPSTIKTEGQLFFTIELCTGTKQKQQVS